MFGYSIGYRWAEKYIYVVFLRYSQKIKNPAWHSINEVMNDICTHFWKDVFGSECTTMHTDNSVFSKFNYFSFLEYFCHFM